MGQRRPFAIGEEEKRVAIASGLVALDFVITEDENDKGRFWAGGSCGNVSAILAYLGWTSYPVARHDRTKAGKRVQSDLKRWNVDTRFITQSTDGSTPIIIHQIFNQHEGGPTHAFRMRCPNCSAWLPQFKAITKEIAGNVSKTVPTADAFYFDRATPGAIDLAEHYTRNGAIVLFEPNSIRDEKLFLRAAKVAHIVKYSQDRMEAYGDLITQVDAPLQVETMGSSGLRFRTRGKQWTPLPALAAPLMRDTAGAGDWLSAGLLHRLGRNEARLEHLEESELVAALIFGQALAAVNCAFDGARGSMNLLDAHTLEATVESIVKKRPAVTKPVGVKPAAVQRMTRICFSCDGTLDAERTMHSKPSPRARTRTQTR